MLGAGQCRRQSCHPTTAEPPVVAGAAAAVVYGFCALIVLQVGARSPDPASGHVFLYESSGRGGRITNYYVTRTFHLISMISGYIAAICLGLPTAAGLCFLIGTTARLMIPARYERANTELSRYRKSVGTAAVTAEGLRYVSAWRDFHRRTALMLSLIVVVIVVVLLGARSDWGVALILGSFVALALALLWQQAFRCPRCRQLFHKRRTRAAPALCVSCGLPQDLPPTATVAASVTE